MLVAIYLKIWASFQPYLYAEVLVTMTFLASFMLDMRSCNPGHRWLRFEVLTLLQVPSPKGSCAFVLDCVFCVFWVAQPNCLRCWIDQITMCNCWNGIRTAVELGSILQLATEQARRLLAWSHIIHISLLSSCLSLNGVWKGVKTGCH
jgi:hypothetical protein